MDIDSIFTVVTLLSILASGAIAVPLAPSFPTSELSYVVDHCEAKILLASGRNWDKAQELTRGETSKKLSTFRVDELLSNGRKGMQEHLREAHTYGGMMLYTSGTTNKPVRSINIRNKKFINLMSWRKVYYFKLVPLLHKANRL